MENLTLKSIQARIKAPTPIFWKKVRRIMIGLGSMGGALKVAPEATSFLHPHLADALITIGVVGTSMATLTCESPEDKSNEDNEHSN